MTKPLSYYERLLDIASDARVSALDRANARTLLLMAVRKEKPEKQHKERKGKDNGNEE